ncbi:DUF5655 domain-containing protein [Haemophilus influenzae]|uniref:Uncharacterized protein HI_1375 n=5 Tax=Haemophilus influenzae TaxID=727 RepID=Y1375_HAEIN|nr:DUF5655 domain-containing protein [Haemophilus influenzae]P44169.1 RecName: Full=Uncharacterized protein HI_1375 [Haemophilus influenzae Rd KW20]AAC23029.1 predicted coding region HI1375 [Haemophilus influenzae Rd KW20]ARB89584.1 hypothetical protein A6J38_03165 [Haemophilus influenzae]EEW76545.1 exonuclease I [Haemophilus influenzae RdAW]MCK8923183.1 DUF5655 domain-containing protein [Haemophilus influenzae]MCK9046131.1 DUF5655 domain-containing protein [Haemophilus influenzae]
MKIFTSKKGQLSQLKQQKFKLEKDIQRLFEENLTLLSGYIFIRSEFSIKNSRIDTLAFDPETQAFVIIEYKRQQNSSVVDQGISYLNLMLEYKADFIVEYNEKQKVPLKRNDVDWSQSKVIFVSPAFNDFQIQATNFKDLPIELWEVNRFDNDIITLNIINKSKSAPNIKAVSNEKREEFSILKEIKVYQESDHLADKTDFIQELYEDFKQGILNLDPDIEINTRKLYIAFKKDRNIADIRIQQKNLKIWINLPYGELDDPKNLAKNVSNTGHWGNGDYEITIESTQYLEYIMSLIKQAIKD